MAGYDDGCYTPWITRYLMVSHHWREVGWVQAQRHTPDANLAFTDEEIVTVPGAMGGTDPPGCPATEPTCSA